MPNGLSEEKLHSELGYSPMQGVRGLYRGYFTTISREIPFSFIQYPVWEYFKVREEGWVVTSSLIKINRG